MKKIIFSLLAICLFVSMSFSAFGFTDLDDDMLYFNSVTFLQDEGIVVGYSDGSFGYDLSINRAELLKIVMEAKYFDIGTSHLDEYADDNCFDDVPANEWYTKYVCHAKYEGWVVGYEDGTFKPAQNITFVEAMKIVMEVLGVEYSESTPWYKGLVEVAAEQNLIPLTIDDFNLIITRSEMADMITRKLKLDAGELNGYLGDQADYKVNYDTISESQDMSEHYSEENGGTDTTASTILDYYCAAAYNVIGGVYDGFMCQYTTYDDFDFNPGFQESFTKEKTFIVEDVAIKKNGDLYYATKEENATGGLDLKLIKYNVASDTSTVLYSTESSADTNLPVLKVVGIDVEKNTLVVTWASEVSELGGVCSTLWYGRDLYSVDLSSPSTELSEYTAPEWKLTEEQAIYNTCV